MCKYKQTQKAIRASFNNMTNRIIIFLSLTIAWLTTSTQASLSAEEEAKQPPAKNNETMLAPGASKARLPIGSRLQEYDEIVSPDMESAGSRANRARVSLR